MKNLPAIIILTVVVSGGLAFFGGVQYGKSQTTAAAVPTAGQFRMGQTGTNGSTKPGNSAAQGSRPVSGEITAVDSQSVTVKTTDGSSKIILFSTSTKFNKTSDGSKSDLQTGASIMAIGTQSTDGTVTATTISIGGTLMQAPPSGNQPGAAGGEPPAAN